MRWLLAIGVIGMLIGGASRPGGTTNNSKGGSKGYSKKEFNVNNCQIPISNYGEFGYMYGFWPRGAGEPYIFGSGLWIGAIKGGVKMVSCGYNSVGAGNDFMPGPQEHNKDVAANPTSHPEDSVLSSLELQDFSIWPNKDSLGNPIILSHQDMWCEYNDCWPAKHLWDPGTKPLNIDVKQLTFGWTTELYANMFFLLYEIKNVGTQPINDMYIGTGSDMDIGLASDDLVGCDVSRSLGYTYTLGQESGWKSKPPYYVGVRFLQGPRAKDTVYVPAPPGPDNPNYPNTIMDTVLPGEHLVLTAFTRCTIGYDASTDAQRFLMLAGYNIETGQYDPWQGVTDDKPDDKRQILGCGPFTLEPGETDSFLVAVMFSSGNTGGLQYLLSEGDAAKSAYDAGWVVPAPPSSPHLTAIPGYGQIALIWDNAPIYEKDPFNKVMRQAGDTIYSEYDFEGFRLWKSRTGLPDDWELVAQWDIKNEITLLPGDMWITTPEHPEGFNVSGKSSTNEGLQFSYIDSNVVNGFTYFYAVTSYDFNTRGAIPNEADIKISLESGKQAVKCSPRAEPCNFIAPEVEKITLTMGNTNSIDSLKATIIGSAGITGNTYRLEWGRIKEKDELTVYTYNIFNLTSAKYLGTGPFEVPTNDEIYVKERKTTPTLIDSVSGDTAVADSIIIIRTTVWDTVDVDTTWRWKGGFSAPFDGLLLSGKVNVNLKENRFLSRQLRRDTLVVKPDVYGRWVDTTVVSSTSSTIPLTDSAFTYFELPDSVNVVNDLGPHTYTGKIKADKFFSGGVGASKWAYHGGRDIEIHWAYYHNSQDSLTMNVFDALTETEIPYDSAFGDNWCFGYIQKPANKYITGTQSPLYRLWFYISGVWYYFNNGNPMNWAGQPDSGDVWHIYSSQKTIPPFEGNAYTIETQKFEYGPTPQMELIKVVPNPYIIRADWDRSKNTRKIQFTHLPSNCTIRIYNLAGDLIRILEHESTAEKGGVEEWDIRTQDDQILASGIYIYHISTPNGEKKLGKIAIIR